MYVSKCIRVATFVIAVASFSRALEAGTITIGFEPTDTIPGSLYGSAAVDPSGGTSNSGVLKMNTANAQSGFLVLNDLDAGQAVGSFVASFNLRMGSDTSPILHGDGLSFNFGPDIPDDVFPFPEEGIGNGLRVSFDSFNNAGPANEAPAVEVTFGGQIIATRPVSFLSTGSGFVPVKIEVHPAGTLDVLYGTNLVFTNLLCYAPIAGRFSLAANAAPERFIGDPIDMHWIDDLAITTTASSGTYVQSAKPRGNGVAPDAVVAIELRDDSTHVNTNSVLLKFDSSLQTASVSKSGQLTSVSYDPGGRLDPSSTHLVELSYADDAVPPKTNSVAFSFTVYPYVNLQLTDAVSPAVVDTNSRGFKLRVHQVGVDAGTSVSRAELQFANKLKNPQDGSILPNIADLSAANPDGSFDVSGVIDFNSSAIPAGYFSFENPIPGLVGTDQYALEVLTYLNLTSGFHTMGVNTVRNYNTTAPGSFRESGFRLTAGANPRDLFATEISSFDKSRPEGDKQFSFNVPLDGIYPFRLLWFSGVGDSSLEWYEVTPQGNRILIGDTASGGLTAYKDALVTSPYVQYTTSPKPGETSVATNATISLTLVNGTSTVMTNSIQLSLNGAGVSPSVSNNPSGPGLVDVSYVKPGGFAPGSTNTVRLNFMDNRATAYDEQWNFVVAGNALIPGLLTVEAEHFNTNTPIASNEHQWEFTTNSTGFSADGAMVALPDVNLNVNVDITQSPRLDYNMDFPITGTYYVWLRALADSAPGSSQNDSVNVGIDGMLPATSARITGFPPGGYVWSRTTIAGTPASLVVTNTGPHVVNVWMREDGFIFD